MGGGSSSDGGGGPKINGSAAAFYVLIIVLSLLVIVAFGAVGYLLLEERAHRRKDRDRGLRRGVDDEEFLRDPTNTTTTTRTNEKTDTTSWYKHIFGYGDTGPGRDRGKGWIKAGTTDEWDFIDSRAPDAESLALVSESPTKAASLNNNETTKRASIATTTRTYYHSPTPSRSSHVQSFISDRSSVLFHNSDFLNLPDRDPSAPSIRDSIPSIYSHLQLPLVPPPSGFSPRNSSRPSSSHFESSAHSISTVSVGTPVMISTTPRMVSSPMSIIEYATSDSHDGSETLYEKPSVQTFERGTKFIEAL